MQRRHLAACLLFAVVLLPQWVGAEDGRLRFQHLTMEDGLSHNFVGAILKDDRGFLWFGTQAGLNRYDGASFALYAHDPSDPHSLPAFSAGVVFEDSHQRMWVGTGWVNEGFALFDRDREEFTRFLPNPGGSGGNHARCMLEDELGTLWVCTDNGLAAMNPETSEVASYPLGPEDTSGEAGVTVYSAHHDRQNRLWVGTGAGLARFDRQTHRYVRWSGLGEEDDALTSAEISSFYEQNDGTLWIGTKAGLHRLEPQTQRVTRYLPDPENPDSISHERVSRLAGDGKERLFVGTEGGGLNILDLRTERFTRFRPDPEDETSLNSASIWSLFFDDQGMLWIGTYDGGVNTLSPLAQRFRHIRARQGELHDPHVSAVMEDRSGDVWIGTDGGGLHRIDHETGEFHLYPEQAKVWTILEDPTNGLWLGGWDLGVRLLVPGKGQVTRFLHDPQRPTSVRSNNVWRIIELSTGELLVVTAVGVDLFDRETHVFSRLSDRYPGAEINLPFGAAEDQRGNLWIVGATILFIDRANGRARELRPDPNDPAGIPSGQTYTVLIDSRGNVWLGGDGGLTCIRAGTMQIRRYSEANGLPNQSVSNIQEDSAGNLWISTGRGLAKLEAGTTIPDDPVFLNFDTSDGIQGYRFTRNASARGPSGRMYFGGSRGLNSFAPTEIVKNPTPPPVVITGLRLLNRPVRYGDEDSPLSRPLSQTDAITLRHDHAMLTIEYAALNYFLPEKNRYEYMLEGDDEDASPVWNKVGTQRLATFARLAPGDYTFRVRGSNNDGVMNEEGAKLGIHVTPPFYLRHWFLLLLGLALVGAGVGGTQVRNRAMRQRRRELEILVEQRTVDLQKEIREHEVTEQRLAGEVSERRRAEEEARQYADRLASSNEELKAGQRALEEKQAALAHENDERRRAEEAAGRERDLLRALMDNIPDLIYFKDSESRFVRVNAALAQALGVARPEDAVGRTYQDFFPREFAQAARAEEQELLRLGTPQLAKLEHHERSGRWYLATKVPLRDIDGKVAGLVGISRDITERREEEQALTRHLAEFRETVRLVARGDLTQKAREGDDTVGQIARSVNEMIAEFAGIIADVHNTASSVSTAAEEIMAAATQIAKGARSGSDDATATSSSVEEMAASMAQVSQNAASSAEKATRVLDYVQQGDRAVDATSAGMARINAAVSQTAEKMRLLEQGSREVFAVIDLIEEISSQSKLLALNAAIEAAHAGDAGRGFGVVAEEVRRLADKSSEATSKISEQVRVMASETEAVIEAMGNAMREAQSGSALSEQAKGHLTGISTLAEDSAGLASQISDASGEQVLAVQTVAEAFQSIADMTTESAAAAHQTAKSVEHLVQLSERLAQAISRFQVERPSAR